jgi:hypothetical protein
LLTWNIEKICFVVVHHELDDNPGVFAEVLEADDPHDVGGVLGVRLFAELVGKDEACCGLLTCLS